jgi:ATP-dependent Clp protease protease subunit
MNWYHITPGTPTCATIVHLHGELGIGNPVSEFIAELGDAKIIELRIDSPGGDVSTGLSIYDALQGRLVAATIIGRWGSAAIAPAMAAHTVTCISTARVLIHAPAKYILGGSAELRHAAYALEQATAHLEQIISQRTKQDPATVRAWLASDTWFTAAEALQAGLVDRIFEPVAFETPALKSGESAGAPEPGKTESEQMFEAWLEAFGKFHVTDRPAFMQKMNHWAFENIL